MQQGWVAQADADNYVQTLVNTLDASMNQTTHLPPRYFNMNTLAPSINEESSIDAAFMALALHQYKQLPTTSAPLRNAIDQVQNRFNFAAFSDTQQPTVGWKLAYKIDTGTFTTGTYDGYSGEPWVISLAAHLADDNHVDITTHYHSAVFRQEAFLVDPDKAHLVHSFNQFRAPFLQWLLPLFVDVSERPVDTYPNANLASNPHHNAVLYQQEVHAALQQLGRALFSQPDAGSSGSQYQQFSLYNSFGEPDVFMPWSVAFSLLADPAFADAALRNHIESGLHSPIGLSDVVHWTTGQPEPSEFPAFHDFWNNALSMLAMLEYLYQDNTFFTNLPEVKAALDKVFQLQGDANNDGQVTGADLIAVQQNFGDIEPGTPTGLLLGDANDDGQVTGADLIAVQQNFGNTLSPANSAAVPEPTSLALLGLGGLAALRCRAA